MKKHLSRSILSLMGWKFGKIVEDIPKCVICVAPHTSNWDFIIGKLAYTAMGRNSNFLIKKEWFVFPFNLFFNWIGGVPVDRSKKTSVTDQMVKMFKSKSEFHLAITPEGTRKPTNKWKKGFYYIAHEAKVPIMLVYFDYAKKEVGYLDVFYTTDDVDHDINTIRKMYTGKVGKIKENFVEIQ